MKTKMQIETVEVDGLLFYCRKGTSDKKAIKEVVERKAYFKKDFSIQPGEKWLDFGGNIGAFTVLAASMGAKVDVFECDPLSCMMIEDNLKLNNLNANIHQKAVTIKNGHAHMSISKTGQFWRNSLIRNWGGGLIKVQTVDFRDYLTPEHCVKMDIEGSEMEVIENWPFQTKKLVFEWSFDMDDNIDRYRAAVQKLRGIYPNIKADSIAEKHKVWQKSWFPPCKNVWCYANN